MTPIMRFEYASRMPKSSVLHKGEMRKINPIPLCKFFGSVEESTQGFVHRRKISVFTPWAIQGAARKGVRAESRVGAIRAQFWVDAHPGIGTKMIACPQFAEPRDRGIICGLGAELPLEGKGWSRVRSSPAKFAIAWIAVRSC